MLNARLPALALVLLGSVSFSYADVEVVFVESAPKDRFVLSNTGQCKLQNLVLNLDLSNSAGRLIFDTTEAGAGVEVFQPFEVSRGDLTLLSSSNVKDGDSVLSVSIGRIDAYGSVSFTIDVDDTLPQSELGNIRVIGAEMRNASVEISSKGKPSAKATFGSDNKAVISLSSC
ncbi:hypothetical protein [Marinomonas posidonica]|uniref:hypothetical protein n=1 Tax=Marinomonas posidonica TaxID=936476 RepID=UPI0037360E7F